MAEDPLRRTALLNYLVSRSTTRNRSGAEPPILSGNELFNLIKLRFDNGVTIEYEGEDSDADDANRMQKNQGKNYVRISDFCITRSQTGDAVYVACLFEFFDKNRKAFHVVDPINYKGRSITGSPAERGAISAHFLAKLPVGESYDIGRYRCALESMPSLSRSVIQHLLSRQLRRISDGEQWTFPFAAIDPKHPRRKPKITQVRYTPRLELHADVGRKLEATSGQKILSSMTFTKYASKETTGGPTIVKQTEFLADVHIKISASDGPKSPLDLLGWAKEIRSYYENLGFKTKLAFKAADGGLNVGQIVPGLDGATDLLICPRETIEFTVDREPWEPKLRDDVIQNLRKLLDRDELWEPLEQD